MELLPFASSQNGFGECVEHILWWTEMMDAEFPESCDFISG